MLDQSDRNLRIPRASSRAASPSEAAGELFIGLGDPPFAALFFFTSGPYDVAELGETLSVFYPDVPIIGCTSAGVIGETGYGENSVSAFGLPSAHFRVDSTLLKDISKIEIAAWQKKSKQLFDRFGHAEIGLDVKKSFGLVLIDGLSLAEEAVLGAIYPEMGDIQMFGGSTGDDLRFEETRIFYDGSSHQDAAAIILVETDCPFKVFRTQHFVETERKMVITQADPISRIVSEINASPAAEEYARLIGVKGEALNASIFAAHPVMVRVGGSYFVRSIQKPEGEDGLRFFCAIDEGLVLTLAEGQDIVQNLKNKLDEIESDIGKPELIIGFDCIFRRLELERDPEKFNQVSKIMAANNIYGFNTYGEQFAGMHVNQTLTGVAIGWPDPKNNDPSGEKDVQ